MQEPVSTLHVKGVELHVGGGGEGCATNEGHFVERGGQRAEGHGSAGAVHDYDSAGVHVWDVIGIGGNVSTGSVGNNKVFD